MLIATSELHEQRGRVTMVDGGFDPLHHGHIEYFERAAALGAPVLCNLAPDAWIERKHPVLLEQPQRARVLDAIRSIDFTHPSSIPTCEVLDELRPRYYAKGSDWEGRLPSDELEACARHGVEVVFLDSVLDSSTRLLRRAGRG